MKHVKTWPDLLKAHNFKEIRSVNDSEGTYSLYESGDHTLSYYWGDDGAKWFYKHKGNYVMGLKKEPQSIHEYILKTSGETS